MSMFSVSDKPKICPVCQSEPSSPQSDDTDEIRMCCGARWHSDLKWGMGMMPSRHEYVWIPLKQCGWATIIAIELLAGKLYDPNIARFKQAGL